MITAMSMLIYKNKGIHGVTIILAKTFIAFVIIFLVIIGINYLSKNYPPQVLHTTWLTLGILFTALIVYRTVKYWDKALLGMKSFLDALPSLLLLVIVIGGIVAGYFTATEASAVAVLYSLILAMIYREMKIKDLSGVILRSVKTTAIVLFLVGTSIGLSWIMAYENIPQNISNGLLSISKSPFIILLIINFILLFVGVFMDMTPAILIFTPIFLPVVQQQLGINPIHFGIIMVLNLSVGLCTPPVGSVLFIGCSVSHVKIEKVIKPLLPMYAAMVFVLLLVTYIPEISLWLPRAFGLMK